MKTNVKTMQDLAAAFPEIYREHKLLCHAQKKAGSVVITVIDEHNNVFQVTGGTAEIAHESLVYWVNAHQEMLARSKKRQKHENIFY